MEAVIEGILFIAGDEGASFEKMRTTLDIKGEELQTILGTMAIAYQKETSGIQLEILGDKVKLITKKEHKQYYEDFFSFDNDSTLTTSSLEVLAIIAYNAPVTRSMVDELRGVSSSHLLRKLLAKSLIEVVGRSELPGRPNLYGTTENFLHYFGLSDVKDLPVIEKSEEKEEKELYTSKYKDEI